MNDHTLAAEYINAGYNHKTILSDVSVTIPQNKISVILGANGCGKSTLLKTFARLLAPQSGQMILDGKNVSEIPSRQMAKMLGLLPQSPVVPEGILGDGSCFQRPVSVSTVFKKHDEGRLRCGGRGNGNYGDHRTYRPGCRGAFRRSAPTRLDCSRISTANRYFAFG